MAFSCVCDVADWVHGRGADDPYAISRKLQAVSPALASASGAVKVGPFLPSILRMIASAH